MATKLLLDEPPLVLQPGLACAVGLNEALFIQQLHYWMRFNLKAGRGMYQGRVWVYNTLEQWHEQFPFWSRSTLQRTIKRCVDAGLADKEMLASDSRDRTLSYSLNYQKLEQVIEDWSSQQPKNDPAEYARGQDAHMRDLRNAGGHFEQTHVVNLSECSTSKRPSVEGVYADRDGKTSPARLHTETTTENISRNSFKKSRMNSFHEPNSLAAALASEDGEL